MASQSFCTWANFFLAGQLFVLGRSERDTHFPLTLSVLLEHPQVPALGITCVVTSFVTVRSQHVVSEKRAFI